MSKNFYGGAVISSGPTLPTPGTVPDGALFMKTGAGAGLYFYGFKPDIGSVTFGEQGGSQWTLLADTGSVSGSGFVLKAGDTVVGPLNIIYGPAPGLSLTSASPGIKFVESDQAAANQNWLFVADGAAMQIQTRSADFSTAVTEFSVDRSGHSYVRGQMVYHTGNLTGLSQLNNDVGFSAPSAGAPLTTLVGGTGASLGLNTGGVVFASSATSMGSGPTGAAGQVLISGGGGSPTWTNQSNLAAGSAVTAQTAASATNAGHATTADTATFATTAGTANLVAYANVAGHPTALSQFTNDIGASTWGALTGTPPNISIFPNNSGYITSAALGPYATNSALSGYAPLTGSGATGTWNINVTGSAGSANSVAWTNVSGRPTALSQFTNDIGAGTTTSLPWSSLTGTPPGVSTFSNNAGYLTSSSLASYAPLNGVGTSGTWPINISGTANAANSVAWTNVSGRPTTVSSFSNDAGYVTGSGSGATGTWGINVSGYAASVSIYNNTSNATVYPVWVAASNGNQSLAVTTGKLSFNPASGDLTAGGNVTAYSDARLKENVSPITDALAKVQSLTGVTFTRKDTDQRGTGLIAQDVFKVLPEAVVNNESGYLSLAYGNLVGLLVEAIKEQQEQISALQSQINDLARR